MWRAYMSASCSLRKRADKRAMKRDSQPSPRFCRKRLSIPMEYQYLVRRAVLHGINPDPSAFCTKQCNLFLVVSAHHLWRIDNALRAS
jgi:hypothetical protein